MQFHVLNLLEVTRHIRGKNNVDDHAAKFSETNDGQSHLHTVTIRLAVRMAMAGAHGRRSRGTTGTSSPIIWSRETLM